MVARAAALLAAMVASAVAQHVGLRVDEADERVGTPLSKPEGRSRIGDDPRRIFQKLTSKSEAERRTAAQQLSWPTSEFPEPFDARLLLVNLDTDDEQEVIFVISGSPATTVALVFDRQGERWWQVGHFSYWWHWDTNQAERFVELREIVKYRRKDIIVRERNGGIGVATTQLSIYRYTMGGSIGCSTPPKTNITTSTEVAPLSQRRAGLSSPKRIQMDGVFWLYIVVPQRNRTRRRRAIP